MTTRTDIAFDYSRSPRIAEVEAASNEVIMQDYVDTIRPLESSFRGMSFTHLMNASGKEDLGGGVLVGITAEEQDLKLSFEASLTAAQVGTVTTGSGAPVRNEITFIDTSATFETNNVARGSMVINFTDQSIADVVEVVDEQTLVTKVLVNGSDNSYDVSDAYQVFNIIQKVTTGGNLVAVDSVDVSFAAILPTAFTQVVQGQASNSTILDISSIETTIDDTNALVQPAAIASAVWDALTAGFLVAGSFGQLVGRKLLKVATFLGLR